MARRGDPERIYVAQRAGVVARMADRIGTERAERVIAAWELEAEARGLARSDPRYRSEREGWLAEELPSELERVTRQD